MSLRTPILTVVCACAVPTVRATASAVELIRYFIPLLLLWARPRRSCSHSQVLVQLVHVGVQVRIGEPVDHPAVLHHIVAVGDSAGEPEVLLHQQDGKPL